MAKFYIVFSPNGPTPPVKVHDSHKQAFGVAHRMAAMHPGQAFHVMVSASKPIVAAAEVCPECIGEALAA